eukprot:957767-Karenia_brevis.AAC.1
MIKQSIKNKTTPTNHQPKLETPSFPTYPSKRSGDVEDISDALKMKMRRMKSKTCLIEDDVEVGENVENAVEVAPGENVENSVEIAP